MSGLHRASKIIGTVWVLALITAIPYAVCTEVLLQYHPITEKVSEYDRRLIMKSYGQNQIFSYDITCYYKYIYM